MKQKTKKQLAKVGRLYDDLWEQLSKLYDYVYDEPTTYLQMSREDETTFTKFVSSCINMVSDARFFYTSVLRSNNISEGGK